MSGRCTVDWYRGWLRHAAEGCETCRRRLRAYNAQAQRDLRHRARAKVPRSRTYTPEFRKVVLDTARRHGARTAAVEHGISRRLVYSWLQAAGIKPKGKT